MMKNATIYRILSPIEGSFADIEAGMQAQAFVPCGASQEKSIGWVPPRGHEHGALLESIGGQWIAKLMIETKKVPAQAIRDKVDEQCKAIEAQTGRKPGKKERRDLTEDARNALLPMAFASRAAILVWIDTAAGMLVIDTASTGKADSVVTALIKSIESLSLTLVNTNTSPAAAMAYWLREREAPQNFSVDRACILKACDESKAVVRYNRHALDTDEVVKHVTQGKLPTQLALTWNDRVSFVLTEGLQIKKIEILDVVFENSESKGDGANNHFDADIALMTGELSKLIAGLIEVLGGEVPVTETPKSDTGAANSDTDDPLYETAVGIVRTHQKASISLVQRHLKIGYNRAAGLIEAMETQGLVSPMQQDGSRKVLTA